MLFNEPYFAPINNYSNKNKGTPDDIIEAVKRERGYIDLDDPEQRRKYSSSDSRVSFRPTVSIERTEGIKRAKIEHKEALKNLKQGTAKTRIKKTVGRPKTTTEMPTAKGQEVLDTLRTEGIYHTSDWALSRKYLEGIIHKARELGYGIQTVKTGMRVSHYKLIGNKKPVTK